VLQELDCTLLVLVWMARVSWSDCVCDGRFSVYVELYTVNTVYDGDIKEVYLIICLFQGESLCRGNSCCTL
jgi:hypothetical protein